MLRRIVTAVIVIPLAVILIAFAVANRQMVTVSFDPFSSTNPAYAASLPLFVLVFDLVIVGVIVGGIAAWVRQSPWRRTARKLDADVRALHDELEAIRHQFGAARPPAQGEPAPKPTPKPASKPASLPVIPPRV